VSDSQRLDAIERALATTIERFLQYPDALYGDADLQGAFCRILLDDPLYAERYITRDGRHTGLVHQAYPAWPSDRPGARGDSSWLDVVVLAPSFVRGHPLAVAANLADRADALRRVAPRVPALRDAAQRDQPRPLLAALALRLLPALAPETLAALQEPLDELVRVERQAQRLYMAVCCTHWDLEQHLLAALPLFEHWAARCPQVSLVVVQAHYDRIGRVAAGRYLNHWSHTALLPPLNTPGQAGSSAPWPRR
jgi:hypothetical protein